MGHEVKVRPLLAQVGLVMFNRYYLDFMVDPRRYRLSLPAWLINRILRWVPQPKLIFVLNAPTEVLYARKQELEQAEIRALHNLAISNPRGRVVRVDRGVEEIVDELERETLAYLDKRVRHCLGWKQIEDRTAVELLL
ncbi:MAG: hypothetical protein ACXWAT_04605 [Methylobacter sp.]